MTEKLYRAWEVLDGEAAPWPGLTEPPPLHRRHAAWAVLTVRPEDPDAFEDLLGRVRGRMRAVITAIEEAGAREVRAWPRPFETGPGFARFAVGLGPAPLDATDLAAIGRRWLERRAGVTVERAEGGAVPPCADPNRLRAGSDWLRAGSESTEMPTKLGPQSPPPMPPMPLPGFPT